MTNTAETITDYWWVDGDYKATGCLYDSYQIQGCTGQAMGTNIRLRQGDFGVADQKIAEETGQKNYNVEISYDIGVELVEFGIVHKNGKKITTKTLLGHGIGYMEWMSGEEAAAFEDAKDPLDALSHPYLEQPGNLGKLLWMTGPPGMGKSTTAQLLARTAGYVYYEGDCFFFFKNPYVPVDAAEPSKAQSFQAGLKGPGLKERMDIVSKGNTEYELMMKGEEYDKKTMEDFYSVLCDEIQRERNRIGGDWVVATIVDKKEWRDFVRSKLGPDLVFIILDMELEQQVERIRGRHDEDESAVNMMKEFYNQCEPKADNEDNAIGLKITRDMTPDMVVKQILSMIV